MRLLLFLIALPLAASPIANSTSVQSTCVWIGPPPFQPDIMLSAFSGSGSSHVSCPVNFAGTSPSASSTVSGTDAIATAQQNFGNQLASGNAQAYAGFEVSGVAAQDGFLPLNFVTFWRLIQDVALSEMSVMFYFNGVQIGGFSPLDDTHDTFPQETISNFVEPVHAGETYTFDAQAMAEVGGTYEAFATVEVQTAIPEPSTIFLVGLVCLGLCLVRARAIR